MGLWDGYDSLGDRVWYDHWSDTETNTAQGRLGRLDGNFNQRAENNAATQAREASEAAVAAVSATAKSVISSVEEARDAAAARLSKNSALKQLKSKPVKFNPPLHHSVRPRKSPYSPSYSSSDLSSKVFDSPEARTSKDWRLGQLVGANEVVGAFKDKKELDHRFGFRFLYNPTTVSMNASVNSSISPNAMRDGSGTLFITGAGLGSVSMEILLNRIPEVSAPRGKKKGKDLTDDEKDLRDKGTMVDLDFLFRVANGTWDVTTGYGAPVVGDKGNDKKGNPKNPKVLQTIYTSETGDIGLLVPTPMWLSIGPGLRYYGWLQEVTHKHTMFSPDMVPMVTRVQLTFQRLNKGSKAEFDQLNEAASQYGVINGDVSAPPPDSKSNAPSGATEAGAFPPNPQWEKSYFGQSLPGPRDAYQNVIASSRAIFDQWPKITDIGSWRPSDPYPDHPSGLALDVMMPGGCAAPGSKDFEMGNEIARYFMENKDRFGVLYMIWQQKIWSSNSPAKPPSEWNGMSDRGSCTANHGDHVHLALYAYPNSKNFTGLESYGNGKTKKGTYWSESYSVVGGDWKIPNKKMLDETGTMSFYQDGVSHRGGGGPHQGEDFGLGFGVSLQAMKEGKVAGSNFTLGGEWGTVYINHRVPGGIFQVCYMHCQDIFVRPGESVSAGQRVAEVGNKGTGGPHLHLEMRLNPNPGDLSVGLLNPNEVLRMMGFNYPAQRGGYASGSYAGRKADYSTQHLNALQQKLNGVVTPRSNPTNRTGT